MTVSALVEANITRLHYREHFKVGTISAQLAVHPDVVKRVLGLLPEPSGERKARCVHNLYWFNYAVIGR